MQGCSWVGGVRSGVVWHCKVDMADIYALYMKIATRQDLNALMKA